MCYWKNEYEFSLFIWKLHDLGSSVWKICILSTLLKMPLTFSMRAFKISILWGFLKTKFKWQWNEILFCTKLQWFLTAVLRAIIITENLTDIQEETWLESMDLGYGKILGGHSTTEHAQKNNICTLVYYRVLIVRKTIRQKFRITVYHTEISEKMFFPYWFYT